MDKNTYCACFHFSLDEQGAFVNLFDGQNQYDVAKAYSLAKYGSYKDLTFFAKEIYKLFKTEIENQSGALWDFLFPLRGTKDYILLLTPGYRNIKASGNIMFDLALPYVNAFLSSNNFPIIADFKLLRPMDPCRNYAMLSCEEREKMGDKTDHILPSKYFFKNGRFHIIYGDDIYITGSSSEKARKVCLKNGAQSFISIFAVMMDQRIARKNPAIEERLNQTYITEKLDKSAIELYDQPKMLPVLRSLELLLAQKNVLNLEEFLDKVPLHNVFLIYSMFLNNENINNLLFKDGLCIVQNYLKKHNMLDINGLPLWEK